MINDIIRHKIDYSLLAIISMVYIMVFLVYQNQPQILIIATCFFGFTYILWGVLHHLKTRTLHPKVVLEYFLVSLLAIALVSTLLI
ncbi:MAG: hypothetical protein WCL07_00090 [bacterium]